MTSKLLPGERVAIEVIHLLNIQTYIWVILTHVAVAALKPNHLTIFPQMFAHFIIRWFKITTAFEKVTWALSIFGMPLQILNSVDMDFTILSAPVSNFDSIDCITKNLRLNWSVRIWVITFTKAAHNAVFLRSLLTLVLQKTGITNDLCTVFALFRVNWNVKAKWAPHQVG